MIPSPLPWFQTADDTYPGDRNVGEGGEKEGTDAREVTEEKDEEKGERKGRKREGGRFKGERGGGEFRQRKG